MERNVQIENRRKGAGRPLFLLLIFFASFFLFGCKKEPSFEKPYSYEARLDNFQNEEQSMRMEAFASKLSVVTGEDATEPALGAESAAVFDLSGGEALFHKNALTRINPASTTKIMTAILTLKYGNLEDLVTVGDEVVINEAGTSMCGIKPGETMTLEQLLYGLMIPSGNDAANAIAVHLAGTTEDFADRMNEEAARLGATKTHFTNANGLTDPDHYTTAYDLYLMFDEALKYPLFREIIGAQSYTADYTDSNGQPKSATWTVGNFYMNSKRETPEGLTVFGGKTGTTKAAGYCLVMGSRTEDGKEYASVIMKAASRDELYDNMTKIISKIVK